DPVPAGVPQGRRRAGLPREGERHPHAAGGACAGRAARARHRQPSLHQWARHLPGRPRCAASTLFGPGRSRGDHPRPPHGGCAGLQSARWWLGGAAMNRRPSDAELLEPVTVSANGNVSPDSESPAAPAPRRRYRRRIVLAFGVVAVVALLTFGVRYVLYARAHESTDDAFIDGHIVGMSPKVASNVARVYVDDNTHVKAGDLLVELDPRDFEARLAQARSNLAAAVQQYRAAFLNARVVERTAGAGVQQSEAAVVTAERQVDGARSRLEQARAQAAVVDAEVLRAKVDAQRY